MDYTKEFEGQKAVSLIRGTDIWIAFDGDTSLNIRTGYYNWRLSYNNKIIMTSSDLYVQYTDPEWINFQPTEYDQSEDAEEIDFDDYTTELFEALDAHIDKKVASANNILENTTVSAFKVNDLHDLTITFSNGALLQVHAVTNIDDTSDKSMRNYIEKSNGRKKDFIFL